MMGLRLAGPSFRNDGSRMRMLFQLRYTTLWAENPAKGSNAKLVTVIAWTEQQVQAKAMRSVFSLRLMRAMRST